MEGIFERALSSRFDLLDPLADEIEGFLAHHVADEDLAYRALLLAMEAVSNAMEHGNRWDAERRVHLKVEATPEHVHIEVEDEGPGFEPAEAPDAVGEGDLLSERHRGLFLMRAYAQSLRYENGGRRLVLDLARA